MTKPLRVIQIAAPVRKAIEERLRSAIMQGAFPPGAHLVDRELCDMFGVSRTVVREAQRSLEAEGLVVIVPHKGVFVRQITYEEAVQIYDVRKVLEALAGQKCAMHATHRDVAELESVYEELKAGVESSSKLDLLEIKSRFYAALLRGAKNAQIEKMLNQILNYNTHLRATSLSEAGRLPRTVEELGRIVEAIKSRDSARAWEACFAHVENASQAAIRVLKE